MAVSPSDDVQAKLTGAPQGTTLCFAAGTYVLRSHLVPRGGQRLVSSVPRGAVFTGEGVHNGGVKHGGATNVTVSGFVFERFMNPYDTWPRTPVHTGAGWVVENNEIAYNSQGGVEVSSGVTLRGNYIHDNGRYGFVGGPLDGLVVEGNEIARNNTARHDLNNDAGGSKIVKSRNVVMRGNYVHHNWGHGLWADWENVSFTYEGNTLVDNYGIGIFHEASGSAVIRNNTFRNNALFASGKSLWNGADLFLNDSKDVEIYGNEIVAGVHGIGLVDSERGSNALGLLEIRNVSVHHNLISVPRGGASGMVGNRSTAYAAANNRFSANTYYVVDATDAGWQWSGIKTWTQWRSAGNDLTGTLYTWAP